jgi:hypothetical protein
MENEDYKRTTDIELAVWLEMHQHYYEIESIPNSTRKIFYFPKITEEVLEKLTQEFYQDEILQEYLYRLKRLKGILFERKPE